MSLDQIVIYRIKMTINLKRLKKIKNRKGQSLVELALTITILVTLLAGAFDLGNAFLDYLALRDAAQEGAVFGSIFPADDDSNPNINQIIAKVKASSTLPLDFSSFSDVNCDVNSDNSICVEIPKPCTGNNADEIGKSNTVTVTVRYYYRLIVPFLGGFLGTQDIPLRASATNVILTTLCPE